MAQHSASLCYFQAKQCSIDAVGIRTRRLGLIIERQWVYATATYYPTEILHARDASGGYSIAKAHKDFRALDSIRGTYGIFKPQCLYTIVVPDERHSSHAIYSDPQDTQHEAEDPERSIRSTHETGLQRNAQHTKRKKCSHGSPKSDQEGQPKADLGIRALGRAEVEQYPVADDKPSTTDGADDCDYYCDTDECKWYGEQESDSLGKDVDALGFSDNRVIYEPMMSFDVMNVTYDKTHLLWQLLWLRSYGKEAPRCCNFRRGRQWGGGTTSVPTFQRFMYESVFKFICSSSRDSHSGSDKGCFFNGVYITCKKSENGTILPKSVYQFCQFESPE
ncbi:hypothetical protein ARMSODRAFT_980460 [Armillaria solidipes]|uniref:Uncharacterized protein n=1 Tax=Armillaria solidipes TaxID=1076256 RepID=A0A2H3B732_9AGAR|nr:hypothetical protein ARMSODRAFT_980460 [Armillaria solidipes]